MLKSMLVNKNFQTWLLIGWQLCCQPIQSQVWKSVLNNMEFIMDFAEQSRPKCILEYTKIIPNVCNGWNQSAVWYKIKFGTQNLGTKFGNDLCMATKIGRQS